MPYTVLLHIAVILWGLLCNSQNSLTILSNIVVVQSCARFHSLMLERLFIFSNCRNDENSIFGLCLSVCAFAGNNNIVRGQHWCRSQNTVLEINSISNRLFVFECEYVCGKTNKNSIAYFVCIYRTRQSKHFRLIFKCFSFDFKWYHSFLLSLPKYFQPIDWAY